MKTNKIIYWISTGLLSALAIMSAGMYIINYEGVSEIFTHLGFPTFLIYPLAGAKILGVAAILTRKNKTLMEWAYAGFFFDFLLAIGAHLNVSDGEQGGAIMALALLILSYIFNKRMETK